MPPYYGIDIYYLVLILPAVILSLIAQVKVKSTFTKYSKIYSQKGLTGAQVAEQVLAYHGVSGVEVQKIKGHLTDHFDPKTNIIRLSDSVYGSCSVAAIGVAAHEAGHAVQHAQNYAPIKVRNSLVPVVNFSSGFSWVAILLGFLFSFQPLVLMGIALFSFAVLFQLITLPVELNASARAVRTIADSGILNQTEQSGAKSVLTAAAMTYVAAAIMSLAQLLRLILLFRRND